MEPPTAQKCLIFRCFFGLFWPFFLYFYLFFRYFLPAFWPILGLKTGLFFEKNGTPQKGRFSCVFVFPPQKPPLKSPIFFTWFRNDPLFGPFFDFLGLFLDPLLRIEVKKRPKKGPNFITNPFFRPFLRKTPMKSVRREAAMFTEKRLKTPKNAYFLPKKGVFLASFWGPFWT